MPVPHCCSSLLHASLCHLKNHLILSGLTADSVRVLSDVLSRAVHWWQRGQEASKRRQEEKDALYKYKTKSHGDDRTEEEMEAQEVRQMFPTYDEVS